MIFLHATGWSKIMKARVKFKAVTKIWSLLKISIFSSSLRQIRRQEQQNSQAGNVCEHLLEGMLEVQWRDKVGSVVYPCGKTTNPDPTDSQIVRTRPPQETFHRHHPTQSGNGSCNGLNWGQTQKANICLSQTNHGSLQPTLIGMHGQRQKVQQENTPVHLQNQITDLLFFWQ